MEVQTKTRVPARKSAKPKSANTTKVSGRSKNLLYSEDSGVLKMQLKDTQARVDQTGASVSDKTILVGEVASRLFSYLNEFRIPTHFIERVSATESRVKELSMIPLCVTVWNSAEADFTRRFGFREGGELPVPVIEHWWKNAPSGKELVSEFHVYSLGIATPEQYRAINRIASKANVVLRSFFERRGLKLVSVTLEFGTAGGQLMIGDEISQRTCMFKDIADQRENGRGRIDCGKASAVVYRQLHDRIVAR